jgi:hypothetical protein
VVISAMDSATTELEYLKESNDRAFFDYRPDA